MLECDCVEWRKNFQQIKEIMLFCQNQTAAPKYAGDIFRYCPWCGKKLQPTIKMECIKEDE